MAASPPREELIRTRLKPFTTLLHGVASAKERPIHRARVASRRLRELLPVLELDPSATAKLVHRLRKVMKKLGKVRELDVLMALAVELGREPGGGRAVRFVEDDIRRARDAARRRFDGKRIADELSRIARKLQKLIRAEEDGESPRSRRWAIDARVARRAMDTKRAVEHAGGLYAQGRLHDLRIASKKFRYALELAADARGTVPATLAADLQLLRRVQSQLGRLHDLQVFVNRVRKIQASGAIVAPSTPRDFDILLVRLDNECRRLHARYVRLSGRLLEVCDRQVARGAVAPAPARKVG